MARSNYNFKKRQKEMKRKKKQEEKRLRKMGQNATDLEENPDQPQTEGEKIDRSPEESDDPSA